MIVDEKLLKKCVEAWGEEAQVNMAIEEMAELIKALMKLRRARGKDFIDRVYDVREEIADVLMTVQQMRLIYGASNVDAQIGRKTERLIERLKEPQKGG